LAGIHLGAAIAEHRREVTIGAADTGDTLHDASRAMLVEQVTNWLPISHRRLQLPDAYGAVLEDGIVVRLDHPRDGWQDWAVAGALGMAASEDRQFTADRELGQLQFGDGYQGRVPAPAGNIALSASFGGGVAGNHAPGLDWQLLDGSAPLRLVSVVPAEGGEEAETLDAARNRVAGSLAQRHRAVTAEDYEFLVENAAGIAAHRAHVAAGYDPAFPCLSIADSVTVFVVPRTEADVTRPQADDGALDLIRTLLDDARLLTMRTFVMRPRIRAVWLVLTVSGYRMEDYRATLEPVLREYLHPALGGPEGTGWPFGAPLRPSELLRVAQDALLRGGRVEKVLIRLPDEDRESDCAELQIGEHELIALESLAVRVVEPAHMEAAL
jgi:predicted phage baseplate assembly protein